MMFMSFSSSTTGATSGAAIEYSFVATEFTHIFCGVRVAQSSFLSQEFCPFPFWSLHCLSFDLWLLTKVKMKERQCSLFGQKWKSIIILRVILPWAFTLDIDKSCLILEIGKSCLTLENQEEGNHIHNLPLYIAVRTSSSSPYNII